MTKNDERKLFHWEIICSILVLCTKIGSGNEKGIIMEKRHLVGKIKCKGEAGCFCMEYYVLEQRDLYSIEIVKEPALGYNREIETVTSFPISRVREVVERLARICMRNSVTPSGLFETLDDIFEI